jgi:hypothetical protein
MWNELGFGGPACPRGFLGLGGPGANTEPFETPGATAVNSVKEDGSMGTFWRPGCVRAGRVP